MKRRLSAILVIMLSLCVLLTGCIETGISVQINEDDGGSVVMSLFIERQFFESMSESGEMSGLEDLTSLGVVEKDGVEYMGYEGVESFGTYSELEAALSGMSSVVDEGSGLFSDVSILREETDLDITYSFKATVVPQGESLGLTGISESEIPDVHVSSEDLESALDMASDLSGMLGSIDGLGDVTDGVEGLEEFGDLASMFGDMAGLMSGDADIEFSTDMPDLENVMGASINDILKFSITIVLPVDITESSGGVASGNTLTCELTDLAVSNVIFASGVLVKEQATEALISDSVDGSETANDSVPNMSVPTSISGGDSVSPPHSSIFWFVVAGALSVVLILCFVLLAQIAKERSKMRRM